MGNTRDNDELELLKLQEEELLLKKQLKDSLPIGIDEPTGQTPDEAIGLLETGTNLLDIAGAPIRSAIYGGLTGERGLKEMYETGLEKGPMEAISEAPSGKDIAADKLGLSREETLGPDWFKFSPAGAAGLATEVATDPFSYISPSKISKPIKLSIGRGRAKQATKLIARELSKVDVLKKGFNPEVMAKQILSEGDLSKYLNRPKALLKKLRGNEGVDELTSGAIKGFKGTRSGSGLIAEAADSTTEMINSIAKEVDTGAGIPRKAIATNVSYKLTDELAKEAGTAIGPKDIEAMEKLIADKFLKTTNELGVNTPYMSITELHELKKGLNRKLTSKDMYKGAEEAIAFEKRIDREAIRVSDSLIKAHLKDVPVEVGGKVVDASEYYTVNNLRQKALINMAETIEDANLKGLKKDDIIAYIRSAAAMGATGAVAGQVISGTPVGGMMVGGAFSAVHSVGKAASKSSPYASMKWFNRLEKSVDPVLNSLPQIQRSATDNSRKPDSLGRSPNSFGRNMDNAAEEIMATPLPRDSQAMMDDPTQMLLKVAQEYPDQYDELKFLVEKRPDLLKQTFPLLINKMPQLFEVDKYNRVDGRVLDPQLRIKAERDLWLRDDISPEDKVKINNMLNKDGSYPL